MKSYVAMNPSPLTVSSDLKTTVNARDVLKITGGLLLPQYFPIWP